MDKHVTPVPANGEKPMHYILDFGLFMNKKGDININLLEKIRDHWNPKIQSHLLVYMFTQTIAMRSQWFNYAEVIFMQLFTFLAGNIAYLVRYPTELHWGITDVYNMRFYLVASMFLIMGVEIIQWRIYRKGYFKKWTNRLQWVLIVCSFFYIGFIPLDATLSVQKTKSVIEIIDSTNIVMNVTHGMVNQKELCRLIKMSNDSNVPWKTDLDATQTIVLQDFISERTTDAADKFKGIVSNVTDVSYLFETIMITNIQ